jgi:WD40 repeat protein
MPPSAEKFAQLLTEGVHRIRLREHKNLSVVQDELGYALGRAGGSAIQYWRKGHLPPDVSAVAELARLLVSRGQMDQAWLVQFLESAGYPHVTAFCQELWSAQTQDAVPPPPTTRHEAVQPKPAHQDWGSAPAVSTFYGRQAELTLLRQWLVGDGCRLVTVLGMGGVGKTTLAARLASEAASHFDGILWRSLLNAPPLDEILWEWLQFLSGRQLAHLPTSLDERLRLLLDYLRRQRCLLVLDNCEAILQEGEQAGQCRFGYEAYGHLLRWMAEQEHRSCLLLTSREQPKEISRLAREKNAVRALELAGITPEAGRALLQEQGLRLPAALSEELVTCYSGNPLALKLVADSIQDLFGGDVALFLGQGIPLFDDIREVLDQQFARLSEVERNIVTWLAIEREAVSLHVLEDDLVQPVSRGELLTAIRALQRRSLLERVEVRGSAGRENHNVFFTLQNVVAEYVSEQLVSTIFQEIVDEQPAWLNRYALLKAQAKEYVRQSQERILLQPLARRLVASLGRVGLEAKLKRILDRLRTEAPLAPGYAAGNILNLLLHLSYDLRGYDFSHLAVWQAYLRGLEVQDVDFSHADLTNGLFTDTLSPVPSVAFSPDGSYLAAATGIGDVRLWQARGDRYSFTPYLTCTGHTSLVWSVCFSPDGRTLASASGDRTARLWDVETGACLHVLEGHSAWVRSVSFSPDGSILASGCDDQSVRLWDVQTGECLRILHGHTSAVWSVCFSPDGRTLASASGDQSVRLWDWQAGTCLHILHGDGGTVWTISFSSDGRILASGSEDQTLRIWDVQTGEYLHMLQGHSSAVRALCFSPDGRFLASGSDDLSVRLWDVQSRECLKILQGHTSAVWSVCFSPDSHTLASGSGDQSIRLWDVQTGRYLHILQGYTAWVRTVCFSPDGRTLASGSGDRTMQLWDVQTGQCLHILQGHTAWIRSVCFSPDGQILASGGMDRSVRLWDTQTLSCQHILQGHTGAVWSVRFSPDGDLLASGSEDHMLRLWNVQTRECVRIFEGHTNWIWSVSFSPDGRKLASGSSDKDIRLWDVETGHCLNVLQGHSAWVRSVAFSPDGQILASSGGDKSIRLWDVQSGQCLAIIHGHTSWARTVCFSPDGRILASCSGDQTVRLWDVETRACLRILEGHTSWVRLISFSPDGRTLASGSEDGTSRLWDVQTGECLHILRSDRPYERMNITGVTGVTTAQKAALKALGAVEG